MSIAYTTDIIVQKMVKKKGLGCNTISQFKVGDLVAWKELSEDCKAGVIKEIYYKEQGGRPVAYARVFLVKDGRKSGPLREEEVIIVKLNLLSGRN
tara:strand:- start:1013 stop:1300 length:288 start_codon:yes stop_codon:yes gene_type:complete